MCGKVGIDEVDSMKNMMAMSVYFLLSDVLELDLMAFDADLELDRDLKVTNENKRTLNETVMDLFNGCILDFSKITTLQDVVDQVINHSRPVLH